MFFEVKTIEMNGIMLPYRFDMYVLDAIQKHYGIGIGDFHLAIRGWERDGDKVKVKGEPNVEMINFAWAWMVLEGYECQDKECPYTEAEIVRLIDKTHFTMSNIIGEEIINFGTKKKDTVGKKSPTMRKKKTTTTE